MTAATKKTADIKMTKPMLAADNARLRDECLRLETSLAKAEARIGYLEAKPAATPVAATPAVTELDVLAAQCGFAPSTIRAIQPRRQNGDIVSTYTKRDGTVWNKVQIGYNQYAHRPAV